LERLLALPAAGPPTAARARALIGVGQLARYLPDWAPARPRVEAGLTLARALGHPRLILAGLRAVAIWRDPARRGRHDYRIAALLEDFAALAAARARPARALRLVGAADAVRAGTGNRRYPLRQAYLDRHLAPARRALGGGGAAALAEGRALTLDQAISEAVDWAPELGAGWPAAAEPHPEEDLPAAGRLRVDGQLYQVWRGEERLAPALSPLEFALVAYLDAHRERVCTRRELGDALWGAHAWDPPMLHNLVRRVKRKLEPAPGGPRYIRSRRGIGYRLTP
jgi:hypothetical protein